MGDANEISDDGSTAVVIGDSNTGSDDATIDGATDVSLDGIGEGVVAAGDTIDSVEGWLVITGDTKDSTEEGSTADKIGADEVTTEEGASDVNIGETNDSEVG